jgi:DNA end-binding protein Ku
MAPRANWKGFLRLSLVTCPLCIRLLPIPRKSASTINKRTGHCIRHLRVDAETGEEVPSESVIKGYLLIAIHTSRSPRKSLRTSR